MDLITVALFGLDGLVSLCSFIEIGGLYEILSRGFGPNKMHLSESILALDHENTLTAGIAFRGAEHR